MTTPYRRHGVFFGSHGFRIGAQSLDLSSQHADLITQGCELLMQVVADEHAEHLHLHFRERRLCCSRLVVMCFVNQTGGVTPLLSNVIHLDHVSVSPPVVRHPLVSIFLTQLLLRPTTAHGAAAARLLGLCALAGSLPRCGFSGHYGCCGGGLQGQGGDGSYSCRRN